MEHPAGCAAATAIVLAGGRSSRMGTAKALLPFDDTPLIVHIVKTLHGMFGEVVVVAAPGQDLPAMPAAIVHDAVANQGPVGGIVYGFEATQTNDAFVTSCDAVFLEPRLVEYLVSLIPGFDAVVPVWHGRLQPLHAVYRKSVVPVLRAQLERGELRLGDLFGSVRTRRVEEEEIRRFDRDGASFFNMNTREDYAEARDRWNARRL